MDTDDPARIEEQTECLGCGFAKIRCWCRIVECCVCHDSVPRYNMTHPNQGACDFLELADYLQDEGAHCCSCDPELNEESENETEVQEELEEEQENEY